MAITSKDTPNKGKPATEAFSGESEEPVKAAPKKKKIEIPDDEDRVLMKMTSDNFSYTTTEGVSFLKEHPFQLVSKGEADILLRTKQFMFADPKEVQEFYKDAK